MDNGDEFLDSQNMNSIIAGTSQPGTLSRGGQAGRLRRNPEVETNQDSKLGSE